MMLGNRGTYHPFQTTHAERLVFQFDLFAVKNKALQDCICRGIATDVVMPFGGRHLSSDDGDDGNVPIELPPP